MILRSYTLYFNKLPVSLDTHLVILLFINNLTVSYTVDTLLLIIALYLFPYLFYLPLSCFPFLDNKKLRTHTFNMLS